MLILFSGKITFFTINSFQFFSFNILKGKCIRKCILLFLFIYLFWGRGHQCYFVNKNICGFKYIVVSQYTVAIVGAIALILIYLGIQKVFPNKFSISSFSSRYKSVTVENSY